MTSPSSYNSPAPTDLGERTAYESYLLEAVYKIVGNPFESEGVYDLIFPPDGSPPAQIIHGMASIELGDWRPGFLTMGAPLIFTTAFKLLDMVMEWVLAQNGHASNFRFSEKIKKLEGPLTFPPLIETHPQLRERLLALYKELAPLRGTIIHNRYFTSVEGVLNVSTAKNGSTVHWSQTDLRNLSLLLVLLVRCLEGSWSLDPYVEKRFYYLLDELAPFHKLAPLGQMMPSYRRARVYVRDEDPIVVDLEKVRTAALWGRHGQDVVYDLRIVAISRDGSGVTTYIVRYDELLGLGSQLVRPRADLERSLEPIYDPIDPVALARALSVL